MFCYQCEQTAKGEGCTKIGVCGKSHEVAALQDGLVAQLVDLSREAVQAREIGVSNAAMDRFICRSLFTTLTNVNFDQEQITALIRRTADYRTDMRSRLQSAGKTPSPSESLPDSLAGLIALGERSGIQSYPAADKDILSLKHIILFGIKGIAAYAYHAFELGREDQAIYRFIQDGLATLADENLTMEALVPMVLQCGQINLRAMELLDEGHTATFGHPVPTAVPLGVCKGKAVLVSGHDLQDLEALLVQTDGKGIHVYTHGEMLPAHAYPRLKKYSHFYGHFGTAWQNQAREFSDFPGPILMTTNCIQKPQASYGDRIFTSGPVGWPGVTHVSRTDFSPVIQKALASPGFPEDSTKGEVTVGFARNAVLGVADKVIDAVKQGHIRHFFLVAGCDGAKPGRNYYTQFAEQVPKDCVILTLACGKFRFFDKSFGDIGGIPRLLDVGQCNDAYSAVQIAVALSKAFNVEVNELPLSMILSWYEQKAVAILLSLLALGIKNIRLGPSLPAFISPNVLDFLVKQFDIKPISTPEADLKAILG
jgi:hydroxylamine reductase